LISAAPSARMALEARVDALRRIQGCAAIRQLALETNR
jgi:hypothetical protein